MNSNRLATNLNAVIPLLGDDHEVAEMLGVSLAEVERWRSGKTIPPAEAVTEIAARLFLDPDALRNGSVNGDSVQGFGTSDGGAPATRSVS